MKARQILIPLFASMLLTIGCSRNNTPPSPPVTPLDTTNRSTATGDTLHWQKVQLNSTAVFTDCWFTDSQHGFVLSSDSLILRTTDGGVNWQPVPGIRGVFYTLDFLNASQGYALGFDQLAITMDGGQSWTHKPLTGVKIDKAKWPYIQFVTAATGYLNAGESLYKTSDTGSTWTEIYVRLTYGLYFSNELTGYAYCYPDSLLQTTDGGGHWQALSSLGTPNSFILNQYTHFHFTDAQHGWFIDSYTLYATVDGGSHWSTQFSSSNKFLFTDLQMLNGQTGYASCLDRLLKTTDGGITWNMVYSNSAFKIESIFFLDEHNGWASCSNGVLLKYHL